MKVTLNGVEHTIVAATNVQALLHANGFGASRVAVEVNREIVPRSTYADRVLTEGDRVEIVHAIGGG